MGKNARVRKTVVSFTPEFWNGYKFISKFESRI